MLKTIGAGWIKQSKNNSSYISVSIEWNGEKIKAMIFKNKEKRQENSPDYRIVVTQDDEKTEETREKIRKTEEDIDVSDIPF